MIDLTERLSNSVTAFKDACADLSQYADTLGYPSSLKAAQAQHVRSAYEIAFLGEDALNYIRQLEAERSKLTDEFKHRSGQMGEAIDLLNAQTWEGFMYRLHELKAENERLRAAQMVAHGHTEVEYYLVSQSLANAKDLVPPDEFGYGLFPRVDALIEKLRALVKEQK